MFESINEKLILNRMKQAIDNGIDTAEGTFTHDLLSPSANEIARLYSMMDYAISQAFLCEAEGEYLTNKAAEFGVIRKEAQKAVGSVTFYGQSGIRIPKSTIVSTVKNLQFETTKEVVMTGETIDVPVQAVNAGEEYNINAYEIKTLSTSIAGVTKVENKDIFVGGRLLEDDDTLRSRTYQKIMYPSASGNANHYKDWAYSVNGVGAAKVIPVWNGPGTVKVIILDVNKKPANGTLINSVKEYIEANRPIGATVTVETAKTVEFTLSVYIKQFGSVLMEDIRTELKEKVNAYLQKIAFEQEKVSYNKIVAILENMDSVSDYKNVQINGLPVGTDLTLDADQIPVLEGVEISAYN